MTTTDFPQTPDTKLPVSGTGSLSVPIATIGGLTIEPSVASTVASVSDTVSAQIEVAQIMAKLRSKLVPILPKFSLSTGINGADQVGEFAQIVNDLSRLRKSNLDEVHV